MRENEHCSAASYVTSGPGRKCLLVEGSEFWKVANSNVLTQGIPVLITLPNSVSNLLATRYLEILNMIAKFSRRSQPLWLQGPTEVEEWFHACNLCPIYVKMKLHTLACCLHGPVGHKTVQNHLIAASPFYSLSMDKQHFISYFIGSDLKIPALFHTKDKISLKRIIFYSVIYFSGWWW